MNQRGNRQRLLNFPVTEEFVAKINEGVAKSGAGDRSKFIRDAIREKLDKMGIEVPVSVWAARSRLSSVFAEAVVPYRVTEASPETPQEPTEKLEKKPRRKKPC